MVAQRRSTRSIASGVIAEKIAIPFSELRCSLFRGWTMGFLRLVQTDEQ
jgi:hypothetical protein